MLTALGRKRTVCLEIKFGNSRHLADRKQNNYQPGDGISKTIMVINISRV